MRLSVFIAQNQEPILKAWESFVRALGPPASVMDIAALRNHVPLILDDITADLETPQSHAEQSEKSLGRGPQEGSPTHAQVHAMQRLEAGYKIEQLVAEYRALRANVLKLWRLSATTVLPTDLDDVTRFNEAIDQALAESVSRFAQTTLEVTENEHHRLDATLQAAPVGIMMVDKAGKVVLANAENRRIWGDVPLTENVVQYAAWKGWWADGTSRQGQALQPNEWAAARALRGEEATRDLVEIEPFNTPGLRKTIFLHAAPIRDAAGHIVGAVVAQTDITAQVKAEAALRDSEARFRTMTDAMPQMVWAWLPDGFVDYYNRQWYDFTGTTDGLAQGKGSAQGQGWVGLFHPDDQSHAWTLWCHSLATGELFEIQYRLRHHSGQYRWVLGRALPVQGEGRKIIRWLGTCTDIHDQKCAEEELKQASLRKDEFLAMLAHELRNPLAPISTAADILRVCGGNPQTVQMASEIITRQVQHMTSLVDDLLDVSRVTRGLIELQSQTMDLKLIVDSAIEQVQPLMQARHHALHLQLCAAPVYVRGDKTRLIQVLSNLLNNAAKYTPLHGEITLALSVQDAQAHLSVSDNGSGIEPLLLPHVFDLFTQGARTPDRAQGGLGLGLTLVKNITALHGGQVTALSDGPGKGSTFNLMLPLVARPATEPADRQTIEAIR